MHKFIPGEVYFRVTYPDRQMGCPVIESFVCIGVRRSPLNAARCAGCSMG